MFCRKEREWNMYYVGKVGNGMSMMQEGKGREYVICRKESEWNFYYVGRKVNRMCII